MTKPANAPNRGNRLILFVMIGLAVLTTAAFLLSHSWTGAGRSKKPVEVLVPPGSSLSRAARLMEKAGALASADQFLTLAKVYGSGAAIQAGEYEVPARASPAEVLRLLQSGRTLQRFVAVPEGMPSVLVYERLMAEPRLTGTLAVPDEGSVLPDSYSFQRGETRAAVMARMQAAMTRTLAELWRTRKPGIAVSSAREAVILASVVEKETGVPAERRTVAGVYSNRLRQGIPLQADPTVIYPVTKGKPLGRRILRSELNADNGYNTYARAGLPAGPIANPGRESLAATLNPAATRAIYFVAKGDGGHVFAETLAEHNANVQRWYAIRRSRGEM